MTKHLIDVDDLLAAAQHELETTGVSDPAGAALQQAVTVSAPFASSNCCAPAA
jgi:hypothetical protein